MDVVKCIIFTTFTKKIKIAMRVLSYKTDTQATNTDRYWNRQYKSLKKHTEKKKKTNTETKIQNKSIVDISSNLHQVY